MYRPEKGNDFKFLDRAINEQFQVGGTDVFVHKYLGPVNPEAGTATPAVPNNSSAIPELGIQDLLLMENRDRHYDPDVYVIRGIYTLQDLDFNLSQFGLFLNNDNIMVNFHLRSSYDALGRKIMAGDVIELPHQKDEFALDDSVVALKRFYVVSEVTRPATGYSQTWYPHLVRAKCQPLVDSQEFKEILDQDSGADDGSTLRDLISTYQKNIDINNQIVAQAAADVGESGYDTRHMYVVPKLNNEKVDVLDASMMDLDASIDNPALDASIVFNSPTHNYYVGYLTGDGIPPNGAYFGQGLTFPGGPVDGQFYLRTDYMPNRLFRYDGRHWVKFEDDVRMTISTQGATQTTDPTKVKQTQKSSFINNTNTATIAGEVVTERQALSKALRPRADN
jgi:molybdopterin converting factor small subunit